MMDGHGFPKGTREPGEFMNEEEKHKLRQDTPEAESRVVNGPGPAANPKQGKVLPPEIGGPKGPEPTRYGDWEVKGRCSDF
jgi:hypothetical protein